jgi:glycosyltransferase involved in cell wall biosynthesis
VSRPRILLLHYTSPSVLGGVEQVMGAQATALRSAGADVAVVAGRGRPSPAGVPLIRIAEVDSRHPTVLRDARALARGEVGPQHERLAAQLVRKLRPLVRRANRVVAHNVLTMHKNLALVAALARLGAEFPGRVVAWTHDLAWRDPRYAAERHAGEPWDRIARALPGIRYVAVSDEVAARLAELAGIDRSEVAVVPNGIDLPAVLGLSASGARLAERLRLYDADPLLLLPARLTRRKRVEAAVAAVGALRERGHSAMLVVTGPPGPHNPANRAYLAELRALVERTPGAHLLHALGVRAPYRLIADLYALADVLVLPSESEGFGIPVLEAGLSRLPVVCSDIPALRAIGGSDATYVPPDADGPAIADAVLARLAGDQAARLRRRAREHAWPRVLAERALPLILDGR